MKRFSLALLALAVALALTPAAQADTFSFTFTGVTNKGANISLSGQLVGTETTTAGVFDIISGSGTFSEPTGCCVGTYSVHPNPDPNSLNPAEFPIDGVIFQYDNKLTPWAPAGGALDYFGLLVFKSEGNLAINIWGTGIGHPYEWAIYDSGGNKGEDGKNGSFTVTPEPGSLMLLGSGFLGLSGLIRRKLMV